MNSKPASIRKQGAKEIREILSLNEIQNGAGDVSQCSSSPEFNLWYAPCSNKTHVA